MDTDTHIFLKINNVWPGTKLGKDLGGAELSFEQDALSSELWAVKKQL